MYQKFLLFQLEKNEEFSNDLSLLFDEYNKKKMSLESNLIAFLQKLSKYAEQFNNNDLIQKSKSWLSVVTTSMDGTNPFTLEPVKLYRNAMKRSVHYKLLNDVSSYFLEDSEKASNTMSKARDLLIQLLLAAVQLNLITQADLKAKYKEVELSALWKKLAPHANLQLFQYNILLLVGKEDAMFLFEEGLVRMAENEGE